MNKYMHMQTYKMIYIYISYMYEQNMHIETYEIVVGEVNVTIKFVVCIYIHKYIKRDRFISCTYE